MAALVSLDRIEGARLRTGLYTRDHTRVAVVTNIDVDPANTDPNVLVKALQGAGMPQIGNAHPSGDGTKVIGHAVDPISNNACRVYILYSLLNDFSNGETNFYLHDSTSGQAIQSQMIPGWLDPKQKPVGGFQVGVSWKDSNGNVVFEDKPATFTYHQPIRAIRASSRFVSRSTVSALGDAMGHVNSKGWFGKPPGYWLLDEVTSDSAYRNGGPYSCAATFKTKNFEPWLTAIVAAMPGGTHARVEESVLEKARKTPYFYGQSGDQFDGFVLVGPYPTLDFSKLPLVGALGSGPGFEFGTIGGGRNGTTSNGTNLV